MSRLKEDCVAYFEDVDDDAEGSNLEPHANSRKYARSGHSSPSKEKPNTGRSRADKRVARHPSESSSSMSPADSDSTTRSDKKSKERDMREARKQKQRESEREQDDRERRKERQRRARDEKEAAERQARHEARAEKEAKALRKQPRPSPLKHSHTQPIVQQHNAYRRAQGDDPSYYGVQQPATSGSRPRAQTRPQSYYAGQPPPRPPISNMGPPVATMGWRQAQPSPGSFAVGTYPPPYGGPSPHIQAGPPLSPSGMPGYFDAPVRSHQGNHLKQRFETGRPSSAMGFSPNPSPMSYPRDYDDEVQTRVSRRPSTSRTKRQSQDRKMMPPPEFIPTRPQSAAVPQTPFRPPPGPRPPSRQNVQSRAAQGRRSVGFAGFDDEDFRGENELFHDLSPDPSHDPRRMMALAREHRRSGGYDNGFDVVPASSRPRRMSTYGAGGASLERDDKYYDAMRYQDDVGGSQVPLTAATLRKAARPQGATSSRSTRSSESRDESEFRNSSTTGITRSSSNNPDDVVIELPDGTVIRMPAAEIKYTDSGDITFMSRAPGSRASSDRSTIQQLEESRSRVDRMERKALPHRARAPSQSDSQSRGYAPYDPALAAGNFF